MFKNICNSCINNCSQNTRCNIKRKNISIINSILTGEAIINPDSAIPFNANRVYISDDIMYDRNNNTDFKIYTAGLYKMSFVTNVRLHLGEAKNNISIAVAINGLLIPGTIVKKSCGQNETVNLSIQVVFSVAEGTTAILNIVNVKDDTPIIVCDNANIIIERIN